MIAVPVETPVTMPLVIPTEAMPGALLVQSPPGVELVNGVLAPEQTLGEPVIAPG